MSWSSEDRRQALHLAMTLWIVALRWITPVQAVWITLAAVVLNWVVLPLTGLGRRSLRRDGEPFVNGVKLYPVGVLLALVLFPYPAAAAGLAVMGVGDAASNVLGRRFGKPPFLGRQDRSAVGTAAFVACGAVAAAAAAMWVAPERPMDGPFLGAVLAAAVAGAAMEYVPWPRPLEDNLPITLAAAGAFTLLAF